MTDIRYEIRVRGHVGDLLVETFGRLESRQERAETVLRGPLRDQAELGAVLEQIRSLGLELIEVRRLRGPSGSTRAESGC